MSAVLNHVSSVTITSNINFRETSSAENSLVSRLRAGERKALISLYDNYSSSLYGIIIRMIRDEEQANDILQETFIKIWKSFHMYDPGKGTLFTWMSNIAKNLALDLLKSKYHRNNNQNVEVVKNQDIIDMKHFVSYNVDTILIKEIYQYLNNDEKLILDSLYFKGYTHMEAAEILNIPVGTLKTRLRSAIKKLRLFF